MIDPGKNWIKLNRSLLVNDLWRKEPFSSGQAWVDLLMLANHSDGYILPRGIKVNVARGQCGYSFKQLAIRWKWSQGKVSRFTLLLKQLDMISFVKIGKNGEVNGDEKTCVSTLITILNYDTYQAGGDENEHQTGSKRGANGEQTGTNKNGKKVKEGKEEPKPLSDDIHYDSILANMNEILSSRYMVTESFKKLVRARIKEGFTEEDFSMVCQKKKAEWGKDVKMSKYLRPATLFNEKMNDYLGGTKEVEEEFDRPEHFRPQGTVKLPDSYYASLKKAMGVTS